MYENTKTNKRPWSLVGCATGRAYFLRWKPLLPSLTSPTSQQVSDFFHKVSAPWGVLRDRLAIQWKVVRLHAQSTVRNVQSRCEAQFLPSQQSIHCSINSFLHDIIDLAIGLQVQIAKSSSRDIALVLATRLPLDETLVLVRTPRVDVVFVPVTNHAGVAQVPVLRLRVDVSWVMVLHIRAESAVFLTPNTMPMYSFFWSAGSVEICFCSTSRRLTSPAASSRSKISKLKHPAGRTHRPKPDGKSPFAPRYI